MALTNIEGEYTAMNNRCPHQGGRFGKRHCTTPVLRLTLNYVAAKGLR
ncbi:MAG: hypothetical protein ACC707_11390 [Thiohalomonadales bacterium]